MTTGTRKTHDFCWINWMTPEAERARAFFGALALAGLGLIGLAASLLRRRLGRA